ncbi:MAG: outer membrane protein [Oricola sp.]
MTFAFGVAMSTQAFAADPMSLSTHDWSGTYAGIQLGYGGGPAVTNELNWPSGTLNDGPLDYDASGLVAGVHVGHNLQSGSFVYGAEADLEYSAISGFWDWNNGNTVNKDIQWTGSLRARAGFAMDRVLVYGTAGMAFASVKMETVNGGAADVLSGTETTLGWTAGVGAEYAIDNAWSTRVEYRYADYGDTQVAGSIFGGPYAYPHDNKVHAVRIGISRKF